MLCPPCERTSAGQWPPALEGPSAGSQATAVDPYCAQGPDRGREGGQDGPVLSSPSTTLVMGSVSDADRAPACRRRGCQGDGFRSACPAPPSGWNAHSSLTSSWGSRGVPAVCWALGLYRQRRHSPPILSLPSRGRGPERAAHVSRGQLPAHKTSPGVRRGGSRGPGVHLGWRLGRGYPRQGPSLGEDREEGEGG